MPSPSASASHQHSYTSCDDENLNNRGYCPRCNALTFEAHDRFRDALEAIAGMKDAEAGLHAAETAREAIEQGCEGIEFHETKDEDNAE